MKKKPKFAKGLPEKLPAALIVAAAVAAVLILRGVFRSAKAKASGIIDKKEVESIAEGAVTPTTDFRALCSILYQAGPLNVWGTDEEAIYAVLGQLNSQADYIYLCRTWTRFWKDLNWFERNWDSNLLADVSTLPGMLKAELTRKELRRCREILEERGIPADF